MGQLALKYWEQQKLCQYTKQMPIAHRLDKLA